MVWTMTGVSRMLRCLWLGLCLAACGDGGEATPLPEPSGHVVVSFNTGTNAGLGHDVPPDDGYGSDEAALSDMYYGDGLAWLDVIADAQAFFERLEPDVVAFQELFYSGDCAAIPDDAKPGFVCEQWQPGDPTVAQLVLGDGWQVACHLGKNDKCIAVHERFGRFAGCDAPLCLDGLDGAEVMDCGGGSRVGRGVIERVDGSRVTVVNVHGTSGLMQPDQDCRLQQFRQVFVDLGDGSGEPAANGERNIILGDLNTDPGRTADFDESAAEWNQHVGEGLRFHFISDVGPDAEPTYATLFNIDHVVSDAFDGACVTPGVTEGEPPVSDVTYFDHKPIVCRVDIAP